MAKSVSESPKFRQLQEGFTPWPPDQGFCPWTPLGTKSPDPLHSPWMLSPHFSNRGYASARNREVPKLMGVVKLADSWWGHRIPVRGQELMSLSRAHNNCCWPAVLHLQDLFIIIRHVTSKFRLQRECFCSQRSSSDQYLLLLLSLAFLLLVDHKLTKCCTIKGSVYTRVWTVYRPHMYNAIEEDLTIFEILWRPTYSKLNQPIALNRWDDTTRWLATGSANFPWDTVSVGAEKMPYVMHLVMMQMQTWNCWESKA
jgi:hypothetical protein